MWEVSLGEEINLTYWKKTTIFRHMYLKTIRAISDFAQDDRDHLCVDEYLYHGTDE